MQQQVEQLLQQQTDRSARTTPIHQAAMAMASRMAPGYAQGAMTGGSAPSGSRSPFSPSESSSGGGPGIGTTVTAATLMALLKNTSFLSALKGLFGGGADPTFGGAIQGNKPLPGGTGFPGVPGLGGGGSGAADQYWYLRGNPNAAQLNPILGGPMSGQGEQYGDDSMTGPFGNIKAY